MSIIGEGEGCSLQEVDERSHGLLRALFHDPMPGVLENDHLNIRGDQLRLGTERNTVRLGSANREDRNRQLRPRQLRKIRCRLRERLEIAEAGSHAAWPRVGL